MAKPTKPLMLGLKIRPLRFIAQLGGPDEQEYDLRITPDQARTLGACLTLLATDQSNWQAATQAEDAKFDGIIPIAERHGEVN